MSIFLKCYYKRSLANLTLMQQVRKTALGATHATFDSIETGLSKRSLVTMDTN